MISLKIIIQRLLQFVLACILVALFVILVSPFVPFIKSFLFVFLDDMSANYIKVVLIFMAMILEEFFRKVIMPLSIWITFWFIIMFIGLFFGLKVLKNKY